MIYGEAPPNVLRAGHRLLSTLLGVVCVDMWCRRSPLPYTSFTTLPPRLPGTTAGPGAGAAAAAAAASAAYLSTASPVRRACRSSGGYTAAMASHTQGLADGARQVINKRFEPSCLEFNGIL